MSGNKSLVVHLESVGSPPTVPPGRFGGGAAAAVAGLGAAASLAWACVRGLRHPRIYLPLTFAQVWETGIASLPLVLLVAMISGAVTSEQTGYQSDLARTARTLTGTSVELRVASGSLRSILGKIDQGQGSLGQAVNNPMLYQALLTAATHVDEAALGARSLVRDLHARPQRYIRVSLF